MLGGTKAWGHDTDHTEVVSLYSDDYSVPSCMANIERFPEKTFKAIAGLVNNGNGARLV